MKRNILGLRFKLLISISLASLLLFFVIYLFAHKNLLQGFSQLERDKTEIQLSTAESLLKDQSDQLSTVARDYAHWNDTYQFIQHADADYIESNLNDTTFNNLKINAIILVNLKGEAVFKKGLDFKTGKPWAFPLELELAFAKGGVLVNPNVENISGLLWSDEGANVVSSFDIRDSELTQARLGTLIMVRRLDISLIQHIGKILGAELELRHFKPLSQNSTPSSPSFKSTTNISALNDDEIIGAKTIKDVYGKEAIVLQVLDEREIFKQGIESLSFLYWCAGLAVLLLVAYGWLIDNVVLKRLQQLFKGVKSIEATSSKVARIQNVEGNDEIAILGRGINAMLGRLDNSLHALGLEKNRSDIILSTLSSIADAVITCNDSGRIIYLNSAAEILLGVTSSDAVGKTLDSVVHLFKDDKHTPINSNWIIDTQSLVEEVTLARADGKSFVVNKSASRLQDTQGDFFGTVAVIHDVTALRALSKQLSYQASHDLLTGLVNRFEFERKLQEAIEDSVTQNRYHCLACIDLDQFKLVNDSCGHIAGDALLKQFSNELKAKMRSADTFARLGGDEFAILLMGCNSDKARLILEDILTFVNKYRFNYDDKVFTVGASIGLTEISPNQNLTLTDLIVIADTACYKAKNSGGNRIHEYLPKDEDLKQQSQQLDWLSRINLGLEKNQFALYMQRIDSLIETRSHCEILIRMKGEEGKLYPPGAFLPVAERYKLMPKIDRWVVAETFAVLATKGDEFPYVCAINISGQTLSDEQFLDFVIDKIKQFSINPKGICFEITETAVISNLDKAKHFIHTLRRIGCGFSLDDFGSGLSSFGYLKNLEVDFLKIDGMFVKSIATNSVDRELVESINNIGHVMQLKTIAEFVENEEILKVLKEIGVDFVQGYGIAMPEPFLSD